MLAGTVVGVDECADDVYRGVDLSRVERCRDVVDFDTHMVAPYNGYAVSAPRQTEDAVV